MRRINFTLDEETIGLLGAIADQQFGGNRSRAIRAAVESFGSKLGTEGWVVSGFTPVEVKEPTHCHCCSRVFDLGQTLYQPVFERGASPRALNALPSDQWLDCATCAGGHL